MFQTVHVAHDGFRQIRQIPFAEPAQRQFPQTLRNADAHGLYFSVDQPVSRHILLQMGEEGEKQERENKNKERNCRRKGCAGGLRIHEPRHKPVQDANAAHHHKIHNDGPECPRFDVFHALFCQGVSALKFFPEHLTAPPLQLSRRW